MKSGLRGGKPRDMATFKKGGMKPKVSKEYEMPLPGGGSMEMEMPMRKMAKGGMTSRGAGAAQRGFNYNIYAEGGKVDSRKGRVRAFDLEGREIPWPPSKEDYSKPPAGKIEYDEGGKRIRAYDRDTGAEVEWPPARRNMDKPPVNLRKDTGKPISASPNREYAKGGKVKKYESGGGVETGSYASFSDWMKDLGKGLGGGKKASEAAAMDEVNAKAQREVDRAREKSESDAGTELRSASKPRATESMPTRPTSQQRRMARRAPPPAPPRPSDTDVMQDILKDMVREERVRKAEMPSEIYRKGGGVKMAGGGSCRGMGAATKGGKYTIK